MSGAIWRIPNITATSDGAYTEGILATLDARYREDKAAFEQALRAADSTAQSLWAQHLAAQ